MSGYALKTPYDATKKRKEYLTELALRAKLDDANLQANKIYKRTGAVSTPPDTRTTTEKLADLYRLRIDIRSKLGQMMSGDDAQKIVNELDQQELIFLTQRMDKFIAELKPKYALGVPYQVFNTYFKNAIRDFNKFGDLDAAKAVLEELGSNSEETKYAIETLTREIQLAGKKEIIFKIENIDKLRNLIDRATYLLNEGAVNPDLEDQVGNAIQAIENVVPTKPELLKIQNDFEKAVRSGDVKTQDNLAQKVISTAVSVDTLENNINDLQRIIQETTQQLPQIPIGTSKQIPERAVVEYEPPFNPENYFSVDDANLILQKLLNKVYTEKIPFVVDLWENTLVPSLSKLGVQVSSRVKSGSTLRQKIVTEVGGMRGLNNWVDNNIEAFKKIFAIEARNVPVQDPFSRLLAEGADIYGGLPSTFNRLNPTGVSSGLVSTPVAQPPPSPPIAPPSPQPPSSRSSSTSSTIQPLSNTEMVAFISMLFNKSSHLKDRKFIKGLFNLNSDFKQLKIGKDAWNEIFNNIENLARNQLTEFIRTKDSIYFDDPTNVDNLTNAFDNYIADEISDISELIVREFNANNSIQLGPYTPTNQFSMIYGGSIKMKKASGRMKGKGVAIDYTAGIATDGERKSNYVPLGKFIINRSKLNDGIIMIKRPNGAFMGDLQSRRVSNKLRNVFEKIVGGSVPSYNDYNKLDADEIEYLHFVAKKSNLLDKLEVPTPKKDDDEKMMNRFEVLRGQLMAGNDNKQMIGEFKKLILDMADKKLLPRRQVSDILIDIERMY
jgi:hypothetical protein